MTSADIDFWVRVAFFCSAVCLTIGYYCSGLAPLLWGACGRFCASEPITRGFLHLVATLIPVLAVSSALALLTSAALQRVSAISPGATTGELPRILTEVGVLAVLMPLALPALRALRWRWIPTVALILAAAVVVQLWWVPKTMRTGEPIASPWRETLAIAAQAHSSVPVDFHLSNVTTFDQGHFFARTLHGLRAAHVLVSDQLQHVLTAEEIAAVAMHELGHVVHRHSYWQILEVAVLGLLVAGATTALATWTARSKVGDQTERWYAPRFAPLLVVSFLSFDAAFGLLYNWRRQLAELEADRFAVCAAPWGRDALAQALRKLAPDARAPADAQGLLASMGRTHPPLQRRLIEIELAMCRPA